MQAWLGHLTSVRKTTAFISIKLPIAALVAFCQMFQLYNLGATAVHQASLAQVQHWERHLIPICGQMEVPLLN